jgi:hypothetical protein
MFGHARTAVKFFVYGLVAGLLFAPRSGAETRAQVMEWASDALGSVLGGGSKSSH